MKIIKMGIFGLGRGASFLNSVLLNDGELVAICDRNEEALNNAKSWAKGDPACYTDFDSFINHPGMEAVFLANCFNEHAPFAIKALEKGLHVVTECLSNVTMAEGVALVRAVEKSGKCFMLAENYPFMLLNQEINRVYKSGNLGKALYCEGEYNHPVNFDNTAEHKSLRPYSNHWRNHLPRTYYISHALAPLMYITGATPKRVCALPVYAPLDEFKHLGNGVGDRAAILTTLNDDDSVFRVTGCAGLGGHRTAYRVCGTKGQADSYRYGEEIATHYNSWDIPEGENEYNNYKPVWPEEIRELAEKAGHGGGDFFVLREFFTAIRENRQPVFDVYFSTACSSVGILGHRSLLENGVPYDIPDFRKEEDRVKYENDHLTPFPGRDGSAGTLPICSHPDYRPTEEQYTNYLKMVGELED